MEEEEEEREEVVEKKEDEEVEKREDEKTGNTMTTVIVTFSFSLQPVPDPRVHNSRRTITTEVGVVQQLSSQ